MAGVCSRDFKKKVYEAGSERVSTLVRNGKVDQAIVELKKMKKFEKTLDGLCEE